MNTKPIIFIALALVFVCEVTWAQDERRLVIEPASPRANEPITISVTNSKCFTTSRVTQQPHDEIDITLSYLFGAPQQCLDENPDSPDFETTVGPLPAGDYRVALFIRYGGFVGNIADTQFFSVMDPLSSTTQISDGGINGLYHDPEAPHRYLYVLETDHTTLVVWNTFDSEGNQLWVYGVGDLFNDGRSIVAETYINTSAGILPSGVADDDVEPWGQIRIDLTSCTEGTVTFQSFFPEFGSGQFSISRLANSKQVGCEDSE